MTGERRGSERGMSWFLAFPSLILQPELYIRSNTIFPLFSVYLHTISRAPQPVSKSSVGSPLWPNWSSASRPWARGYRVLRALWGPPWFWRMAIHVWSPWSASRNQLANCSLLMKRSVRHIYWANCFLKKESCINSCLVQTWREISDELHRQISLWTAS